MPNILKGLLIKFTFFIKPLCENPCNNQRQSDKGSDEQRLFQNKTDKNERKERREKNQIAGFGIVYTQLQRFHPKNIGDSYFKNSHINGCIQSGSRCYRKPGKKEHHHRQKQKSKQEIQKQFHNAISFVADIQNPV